MSPPPSKVVRLPSVPALSWDDCRLLVESVADYAIFMLDVQGRVATWNLGAERIKGYRADEIIGEHFSKFFTPEDVAAGKPERELTLAAEHGRFEDESWRIRKDATRFWANVILTALRDETGKLRGFGKVTRDLTDRKQAEETARELLREQTARAVAERADARVRESEAKYRELSRRLEVILEGIEDGITVQDPSGRLVFANTAGARACGMSSVEELLTSPNAEVIGRFEILDEAGMPIAPESFPGRRSLRGEKPAPMLMQVHERATGRRWWSMVRARPVLGEDGAPELAVNILHDVTAERRRQLQAQYLADATSALGGSLVIDEMLSMLGRVLVPGLGDWCSIYLLEGERLRDVTVADEKAKEQLGKAYLEEYPPDPHHAGGVWGVIRTGKAEAVNGITDEMLRQSTRDPEALATLRSMGPKAAVLAPLRVRDKILGAIALVSAESNRTYDDSDCALVEELGRKVGVAVENAQLYAAAQDSAERAELSKKAAEAAAKTAEEASRQKDEFLATVSHELRTPLNAIVGWSSLIKGRVKDASIAKPLEVIHRNAQAQVKIVEDILDVSRVITGKFRIEPKPADLVTIAREAIEVVRPSAAAKRIAIHFRSESELCLLVADPERLQQVVWNLLSNAVKFTEAGGQIHVSVTSMGSNISLSVSDTGKGIDPAFLPFVFDRFRQADGSIARRFGGLGLGLALVRHIVDLHGGRVDATSEGTGKGATFTITLPVRAVMPATVAARPSSRQVESVGSAPTGTLTGVRVLIVDDETDARDLIQTVLTEAGAVVQTARSAAEGMEILQAFRPDVLVSDIGMPEEDGYVFIRRVRSLAPSEGGRIPSLALTAYAREEDRTKALSMGYTTHIGKPVNPEALAAAVQNLASSFVYRG